MQFSDPALQGRAGGREARTLVSNFTLSGERLYTVPARAAAAASRTCSRRARSAPSAARGGAPPRAAAAALRRPCPAPRSNPNQPTPVKSQSAQTGQTPNSHEGGGWTAPSSPGARAPRAAPAPARAAPARPAATSRVMRNARPRHGPPDFGAGGGDCRSHGAEEEICVRFALEGETSAANSY